MTFEVAATAVNVRGRVTPTVAVIVDVAVNTALKRRLTVAAIVDVPVIVGWIVANRVIPTDILDVAENDGTK